MRKLPTIFKLFPRDETNLVAWQQRLVANWPVIDLMPNPPNVSASGDRYYVVCSDESEITPELRQRIVEYCGDYPGAEERIPSVEVLRRLWLEDKDVRFPPLI
jgi:hypothetical protein